jgi:hypothetical protein
MEIYMHNLNKITKILGATLVLVTSNAAMAEDLTITTSAVVDNTIDFTVIGTLDFGTLRATASATVNECAVLVLPADATASITSALIAGSEANTLCNGEPVNSNSVVQSVGGTIVRPEFTVAGLAEFTTLEITVPIAGDDIYLSQGGDPAAASVLEMVDFTIYQTNATPAELTVDASGNTNITSDGTGAINFTLGATLVTDVKASSLAYVNQPYSGSFDVSIDY